jgi:hypothetical protein
MVGSTVYINGYNYIYLRTDRHELYDGHTVKKTKPDNKKQNYNKQNINLNS